MDLDIFQTSSKTVVCVCVSYHEQFVVNCVHMVYCKRKIQMTIIVVKINCLGRQPDVKQSFFLQDFRKWKPVMIPDYTQCVKKRKNLGKKKHTIKFGCHST